MALKECRWIARLNIEISNRNFSKVWEIEVKLDLEIGIERYGKEARLIQKIIGKDPSSWCPPLPAYSDPTPF